MSEREDLPILNAAQRSVIESAIRTHDGMLVRWLAQKLGDAETARDIAQSAYLRVWRYAHREGVDNLQALIFKTAANLAANEFRARKRRGFLGAEPRGDSPDPANQVADDNPSAERMVIDKEALNGCLAAIGDLPPNARRAFIMSRFEEKSYRDIARELRVSESSVEKYIILALKKLRESIRHPEDAGVIIPFAAARDGRRSGGR